MSEEKPKYTIYTLKENGYNKEIIEVKGQTKKDTLELYDDVRSRQTKETGGRR